MACCGRMENNTRSCGARRVVTAERMLPKSTPAVKTTLLPQSLLPRLRNLAVRIWAKSPGLTGRLRLLSSRRKCIECHGRKKRCLRKRIAALGGIGFTRNGFINGVDLEYSFRSYFAPVRNHRKPPTRRSAL